ncbi:MAG: D-2-hydroxyacid dehydrogenase [Terriglobales bacterium]
MATAAKLVIAMHSVRGIWHWPAAATDRLRAEYPQVAFHEYPRDSEDPLTPASAAADAVLFSDADAVIAWRLDPRLYRNARRLRWIHCPSAAVHQLLTPELAAGPIVITNGASVHAAMVAEHGLALLLALARGLPQAQRSQAERRWAPEAWLGQLRRLAGSTVVLAGLGHIGRELAPRLAALGVTVLGVRRRPELAVAGCAAVYADAELESLLPRADALILALPSTGATAARIGPAQLALLPRRAFLVNLGRGSALDETALHEALVAGRLAGAALDVFAHEPLPPDSPLWHCPSVIITPHVAAAVPDTWEQQTALVARHLRRFLAGEPLEPQVDKVRGY